MLALRSTRPTVASTYPSSFLRVSGGEPTTDLVIILNPVEVVLRVVPLGNTSVLLGERVLLNDDDVPNSRQIFYHAVGMSKHVIDFVQVW